MKRFKWELLKKKERGLKLPEKTISIAKTCVNFSNDLKPFFEGYDFCEVYLNREEGLIGFKPSNDRIKGFSVKTKGKVPSIKAEMLGNIETGRYFGEWDAVEEMVVTDLNKKRD